MCRIDDGQYATSCGSRPGARLRRHLNLKLLEGAGAEAATTPGLFAVSGSKR